MPLRLEKSDRTKSGVFCRSYSASTPRGQTGESAALSPLCIRVADCSHRPLGADSKLASILYLAHTAHSMKRALTWTDRIGNALGSGTLDEADRAVISGHRGFCLRPERKRDDLVGEGHLGHWKFIEPQSWIDSR